MFCLTYSRLVKLKKVRNIHWSATTLKPPNIAQNHNLQSKLQPSRPLVPAKDVSNVALGSWDMECGATVISYPIPWMPCWFWNWGDWGSSQSLLCVEFGVWPIVVLFNCVFLMFWLMVMISPWKKPQKASVYWQVVFFNLLYYPFIVFVMCFICFVNSHIA